MTHEPECTRYGFDQRDGDCICDIIRAAYQRGREDAAEAVVALCRENPYIFPNDPASIDAAIAAARGDGEQA